VVPLREVIDGEMPVEVLSTRNVGFVIVVDVEVSQHRVNDVGVLVWETDEFLLVEGEERVRAEQVGEDGGAAAQERDVAVELVGLDEDC
jgi:hypothetical protein